MTSRPLVSVVTPVLNAGHTLPLTIQSIFRQTCEDWELIVIDDGSTDNTVEILAALKDDRIKVLIDNRHKGIAARANEAIHMARGKYLARVDSDDISYPERFEAQIELLEREDSISLLGTGAIVFNNVGEAIGKLPVELTHDDICQHPWFGFHFAQPTWMGRTDWFRKNLYDITCRRAEDQELLLRTYNRSRFASLPGLLVGYRQHALSLKKSLIGRTDFTRTVVKKAIAERVPIDGLLGIGKQILMGFADAVAISSGLGRTILRHQALAITEVERNCWNTVWQSLQDPEATHGRVGRVTA